MAVIQPNKYTLQQKPEMVSLLDMAKKPALDVERGKTLIKDGIDTINKQKLRKKLDEVGQQALEGETKAINELAMMPDGAELAASLQQIAQTRNESLMKQAQQRIQEKGQLAGSLLNETETFKRGMLRRKAIELKQEGRIEEGNEMMRIAQLPINELDAELRHSFNIATPAEQFFKHRLGGLADLKKIREEVRGGINKATTKMNADVQDIEEKFGRIQNLASEISADNRMAVAQALIALVKLGEPSSAVLDGEMRAALNLKDPLKVIQEMGSALMGNATTPELKELGAKLDALGPENVKEGDLMATARAIVNSRIKPMADSYSQYEEYGDILTEEGKQGAFVPGLKDRISNLYSLTAGAPDGAPAGPAAPQINIGNRPVQSFNSVQEIPVDEFRALPKEQKLEIFQYFSGGGQ